jgi:hypothetical protein
MSALKERALEAQLVLRNLVQVYTCHGLRGEPKRLKLAMLTAYFDESGTAKADRLCAVSGFIGNEKQWESFIGEWFDVRGATAPPLHLTKLRWKKHHSSIASNLAKLGAIPHHYNLTPVSVQIWHRDYEDLVKGRVIDELHPYTFCAEACIALTLENISPNDEVMFIFDWQEGKRAEWMTRLHNVVFKWHKLDPRLKDIDFRRMKSTPCLEVADHLAFAVRHHKIDQNSPKARASSPVLAAKRGWTGTYTREMLKEMVDDFVAQRLTLMNKPQQASQRLIEFMAKERWRRIYAKKRS